MERSAGNREEASGSDNRVKRLLWSIVWFLLARPLPRSLFNAWKILLLRSFGARLNKTAVVYSSARIYWPPNLEMEEYSIIGADVDCYNVARVKLEAYAIVSQKSYLCSASHDFTRNDMPLITGPITIGRQAWVAADAFIGMGVTVGEGAVVGARSSVYRDVDPWTVVGGNPARFIKKRELI